MKNFMVANINKESNSRYSFDNLDVLLKAQVDNSLDLGWNIDDIILIANFDYEFMGVKSIKTKLNTTCLTGSKMFSIKWLFENTDIDEVIFAHDLDCWQNVWFSEPEFADVGIARYSSKKFNGGSLFWRRSALDIVNLVVETIIDKGEVREEPTLNKILKSNEYTDRVTVVNNTFNVGCSGFVKRYNRSIKPIHVCHFHPYNTIAWETHALDRNKIDEVAITVRLERLLRKYYPLLATSVAKKRK